MENLEVTKIVDNNITLISANKIDGIFRINKIKTFDSSQEEQFTEDSSTDNTPDNSSDNSTDKREVYSIIESKNSLNLNLNFPFQDLKTINQVINNELLEVLPFETDQHHLVMDVHKQGSDKSNVMISISNEQIISDTINIHNMANLEPVFITTEDASLASLKHLISNRPNDFIIASYTDKLSILVFKNDEVCGFYTEPKSSIQNLKSNLELVKLSAHANHNANPQICYLFINGEEFDLQISDINIEVFDLSSIVEINKDDLTDNSFSSNSISWAIPLLVERSLRENNKESLPSVLNFRSGKFGLNKLTTEIIEIFKKEVFWFGSFIFAVVFYFFISNYSITHQYNSLNKQIQNFLSENVSDAVILPGAEIQNLQSEIENLESKLKDMGSLNLLSPTESLLKLSTIIPNSIKLNISSLSIGQKGINFTGSVKDTPTAGKLESILKSEESLFCDVNVQSRDKSAEKLNIVVDIKFCTK